MPKLEIIDNTSLVGPQIFIQINDITGFYKSPDGHFINLIVRNSSENVPIYSHRFTSDIESHVRELISATYSKQSAPENEKSPQNQSYGLFIENDLIEFSGNEINIWMLGKKSGGKMWPMSFDRKTFAAFYNCSKTLQKNYLSYSDPEVYITFENERFVITKIDRSSSNDRPHIVIYHFDKEQIIDFVQKHQNDGF